MPKYAHHINTVRIIGGKWRSRKLRFPPQLELRPSTDRLRETLFNWLQAYIIGSKCLDLCAGSGALGFEALSRGADAVTMLDNNGVVCNYLLQQQQVLQIAHAALAVKHMQVQDFLACNTLREQFDIVFCDPPFTKPALYTQISDLLISQQWLMPEALIYMEMPLQMPNFVVPSSFKLYRESRQGNVQALLLLYVPVQHHASVPSCDDDGNLSS